MENLIYNADSITFYKTYIAVYCKCRSYAYNDLVESVINFIINHKLKPKIKFVGVNMRNYTKLFCQTYKIIIQNCDFDNNADIIEYISNNAIEIRFDYNYYNCLEYLSTMKLYNLTNLTLYNCGMSKFSDWITNLVNLKYLDLSGNSLSNIPDSFINLTKLKYLRLNSNSFTVIPDVIQHLDLKYIYFDYNKITTVPDFVNNFSRLKWLYLDNTNVEILPKNITKEVRCCNTPLYRKFITLTSVGYNYYKSMVKYSNLLHVVNYTISYLAIVHNVPLNVVSCIAASLLASLH